MEAVKQGANAACSACCPASYCVPPACSGMRSGVSSRFLWAMTCAHTCSNPDLVITRVMHLGHAYMMGGCHVQWENASWPCQGNEAREGKQLKTPV